MTSRRISRREFLTRGAVGAGGTQKYVFHSHILEHEDNDMMRSYEVIG